MGRSMTGFANLESPWNNELLLVEMKSLNARHPDLKLRLTKELAPLEQKIRDFLTTLSIPTRGHLEIRIDLKSSQSRIPLKIRPSVAASHFESLKSLNKMLGITEPIGLKELLSLPDIYSQTELDTPVLDELFRAVTNSLQACLKKLIDSQENEGKKLTEILRKATDLSLSKLKEIQSHFKNHDPTEQYKQRFEQKISPEMRNLSPDQKQLLQVEFVRMLALKVEAIDIEEEINRALLHLEEIKGLLKNPSPVGRRLEFYLQELSRELNTLGSKAQAIEVSKWVVDLKILAEQMREQVLNIE